MDRLLQDVRYAFRQFHRSPGFTLVAVLTLALGIGATTAIFSVVDTVLLEPLAYRESSRLVAVFGSERGGHESRNPTSPANFLDWKEQSRTLEDMTAAHPWSPTLTGREAPVRLSGLKASASLFDLLGVPAVLGRTFAGTGDERVVVLGHDLWRQQFSGDPGIIGRQITLDGAGHTVIGVMPPDFQFPPFWATGAELWVPLTFTPEEASERDARFLRVFGRLKPDATLAQAQLEMRTIAQRLQLEYPEANADVGINVEALREPVVGDVRTPLLVLLGAVGFVLLIACANVANLLLGRAVARRRETAIRAALGASRRRLVRQWLTESLLLALAGGVAGLVLATWGVDLLVNLGPENLPRLDEIRPDSSVLGFVLLVSLFTGVVFGVAPALRTASSNLAGAPGGRFEGTRHGSRLRRILVGSQIALALVLSVGAGLLIRSFIVLQSSQPGFRTEDLLTMSVSLAGSAHAEPPMQQQLFTEMLREVEALPGVRDAALVNHFPISGDFWRNGLNIEGRVQTTGEPPPASFRVVSPEYFGTMGTPLVRGRQFDERDTEDATGVVIVNQTLARRFWEGQDPVGQRLRLGGPDSEDPWLTVVGVVGDAAQQGLTEKVIPEVYFPYSQNPVAWWTSATLVIHETAGATNLAARVREIVSEIDPGVPVFDVLTMEQILADHLQRQRFNTIVLGIFAFTALVMAVVGLYGVISFLVGQRTREIGIRMAVGAARSDIARLIIGEAAMLAVVAVVVGLLASLALTRYLGTMLFGVSPTDPLVFAGTAALLAVVALAASYLPARRATRVDPMIALRSE